MPRKLDILLLLVINNGIILCWGQSVCTQAKVTTATLPITFSTYQYTIAIAANDFVDYYVSSISTYCISTSQFQYVIGGWNNSTFYTGYIYFITIGY